MPRACTHTCLRVPSTPTQTPPNTKNIIKEKHKVGKLRPGAMAAGASAPSCSAQADGGAVCAMAGSTPEHLWSHVVRALGPWFVLIGNSDTRGFVMALMQIAATAAAAAGAAHHDDFNGTDRRAVVPSRAAWLWSMNRSLWNERMHSDCRSATACCEECWASRICFPPTTVRQRGSRVSATHGRRRRAQRPARQRPALVRRYALPPLTSAF